MPDVVDIGKKQFYKKPIIIIIIIIIDCKMDNESGLSDFTIEVGGILLVAYALASVAPDIILRAIMLVIECY